MTPQRLQQIEPILDQLLETPIEQQATLLRQLCGDDLALRQDVACALQQAQNDTQALEVPTIAQENNTPLRQSAPQIIGNYRIVDKLGEGGMGVVYLAERNDQEFQQQVAIKMVSAHVHSSLGREILQRFRQERQILASLNHPHIARLLDGGTTPEGFPYVVMEYVAGLPLKKFCDQNQLALTERLRLFQKVCEAVQFAHQQLIIHRDLKPGNILVSETGEVKLLDFGIAKLLQPDRLDIDDTPTHTTPMMTPEYASPEQIRGQPIGTASDVYSLGLILYELLTGQRPYQLANRSWPEMLRLICDEPPPKPSSVAKKTKELTEQPSPPIQKLSQNLKGDLDTIILTALQKAPAQRYASAVSLKEDITRYLDGLPIHAHKASFGYRAGKFIRRHKMAVFSAGLLLTTLIGGAIAITQQKVARFLAQSRQRILYSAQMNLAAQAWETNTLPRTRELLMAQIPQAGDEDLRGFEWYYLWHKLNQRGELSVFSHPAGVWVAAFSTDGTQVATACDDHQVRLWETATGKLLAELKGHTSVVLHVTFSPDGRKLLSSSNDKTAIVWDITTRQPLLTLRGHTAKVSRAIFSPDGQTIASCSDDSYWKLWDAQTGKERLSVKSHPSLVRAIAFSPDGKTIATGGNQQSVKLWDAQTGREIPFVGKQESWQCWTIAFSPDGTMLAAGGITSVVKLWELRSGRELKTFTIPGFQVSNVAFSPDGKRLTTTSDNRVAHIWDIATAHQIAELKGHGDAIYSISYSSNGTQLLTAAFDKTARLWDEQRLLNLFDEEPIKATVDVRAYAPNYQVFVKGDEQSVKLYNPASGQMIKELGRPKTYIDRFVFSPDSRKLASGDTTGHIQIWDLQSSQILLSLQEDLHEVTALAYATSGKFIAAGKNDFKLRLWDANTGQLLLTSDKLPSFVNVIAFSPDDKLLATASYDWKTRLWDVSTGQLLKEFGGHERPIISLAFSRDGKFLATGGEDDTLYLWDLQSMTVVSTIRELIGQATALTFSADGKRLVIGSHNGFVSIWDPFLRLEMLSSKRHANRVILTSFADDGQTLITGDRTGIIRYWSTTSKELQN